MQEYPRPVLSTLRPVPEDVLDQQLERLSPFIGEGQTRDLPLAEWPAPQAAALRAFWSGAHATVFPGTQVWVRSVVVPPDTLPTTTDILAFVIQVPGMEATWAIGPDRSRQPWEAWVADRQAQGETWVPLNESLLQFVRYAAFDPNALHRAVRHAQATVESGLGIGLCFTSATAATWSEETRNQFVEDLWCFSCHPYWGRRIADDLMHTGERTTTVQAVLSRQLDQVQEMVAPYGVSLTRTWPMPQKGYKEVPADEPLPQSPRQQMRSRGP